jgi:ATP-dependent helicase/nuclease subunit A
MGFIYTKDQQKVIDTRGCNVLVSAAAGSGKTAVLVERIISIITNKENLISIDELLIVTFTHAAASEMKERIGNGIEKAIESAIDDRVLNHLIKQLTLLSAANIMTLHSFCLKVIKNYYHIIDLDPGFRIGNETELVLIKEEVIEELLEEEYEKASESFIQVVESYASGKNDNPLKELVFQIYRFAMSNPWPDEWFDSCRIKLEIHTLEDYINSPYFVILKTVVLQNLTLMDSSFRELNELMEASEGPNKYLDTVSALYELNEGLIEHIKANNYKEVKNPHVNAHLM